MSDSNNIEITLQKNTSYMDFVEDEGLIIGVYEWFH
jgi:hypothetical protein